MTDKQMTTQSNGISQQLEQAVPIRRLTPVVDIYETPEELVLLADMPGVVDSGLQVEIARGLLTLEAELPAADGDAKIAYYRQFKLSERIDGDAGEASLKDGVLTLRLPKVEEAKPKKIAVRTLH